MAPMGFHVALLFCLACHSCCFAFQLSESRMRRRYQTTMLCSSNVVEQCYDAWNRRDMNAAVGCFADKFEYRDYQYIGSFTKKNELMEHFVRGANVLPPDSQLIVDDMAVCSMSCNIATRWHVEKIDGSTVPFTSGCSFYTTTDSNNNGSRLINGGFRVSEMLVKPSKDVADRLVSGASQFLQPQTSKGLESSSPSPLTTFTGGSIIEQYFEAWNERDIDSALDCFVEDCTYQVEDPVFVDTFEGKAALRDHLVKNAAVLPSSCRIILDDTAVDSSNGKIGTRWHLEINGVAVPNLKGCSMYTTDLATGLLQSGFDVTEAPIKLPRTALASVFSIPAKLAFAPYPNIK